jgi:hypothetical protein
LNELRQAFGKIVFFSGFGARTVSAMEEQMHFFAECMRLSPPTAMVSSVHPKSIDVDVGGMRYIDRWTRLLRDTFGEHFIDLAGEFSGDHLAVGSEATVAGGGSVLLRAAYSGSRAVRIVTPSIVALTKEETGFEEYPFSGAMPEINAPVDIFSLPIPDKRFLASLRPYDPNIALRAILESLD